MKIATWNVNSFNVRQAQVMQWLNEQQPDILVLQELKMEQDKFPAAALQMMGWNVAWRGQKTYNGVAIISRHPLEDIQSGLPLLPDDPQQRVLAATIHGVRVINVYCVNGEALDSQKFIYKQQWFAALTDLVRQELTRHSQLILLGDFNIAPTNEDLYNPEAGEKILCSHQERTWFKALLDLGLTDALRHVYPTGKYDTWWDYRGAMFQRGLGMRIDHLLISQAMTSRLQDVKVDKATRALERPSDHAPVFGLFTD